MSHKEKVLELYSRTYRNCEHYKEEGNEKALLNEIGVLRGIAYCLEAITGDNLFNEIDFCKFRTMIDEQNRLRNAKDEQGTGRPRHEIGKPVAFYTGGGIYVSAMYIDENRYIAIDNDWHVDSFCIYDSREESEYQDMDFPCQNLIGETFMKDFTEQDLSNYRKLYAELEKVTDTI